MSPTTHKILAAAISGAALALSAYLSGGTVFDWRTALGVSVGGALGAVFIRRKGDVLADTTTVTATITEPATVAALATHEDLNQ